MSHGLQKNRRVRSNKCRRNPWRTLREREQSDASRLPFVDFTIQQKSAADSVPQRAARTNTPVEMSNRSSILWDFCKGDSVWPQTVARPNAGCRYRFDQSDNRHPSIFVRVVFLKEISSLGGFQYRPSPQGPDSLFTSDHFHSCPRYSSVGVMGNLLHHITQRCDWL